MLLVVVVNNGDNYDNAYASHYFLFIKRHFIYGFSWKKKKKIQAIFNPNN